MSLHPGAFEYLAPTEAQKQRMARVREAAAIFADVLGATLPEGPDKIYVLRTLRTVAMWSNVAITRHQDGAPRNDK
jgi:hypothetical protein